MGFIVVAYYTQNTLYEQEIKKLEISCKYAGLKIHTKGYVDRGSWVKNCAIKPRFIYDMLQTHPQFDLLYIDADALVRQYPKIFDSFSGDIGIHFRNGKELLSGTVYLSNNEKVRQLVKHWAEEQRKDETKWDQRVLHDVLKKHRDIKVVNLPPTYTQIFDSMRRAGKPVIEHFQASRRMKNNQWLQNINPTSIVPNSINGVRIRQLNDGTYAITRNNVRVEAFMDKECVRIPNELRWRPRYGNHESLEVLRPYFKDKVCYIIGKGPSLDLLNASYFEPDCPVICLNESVFKVEELDLANFTIGLQQDSKLSATCYPNKSPILVSTKAVNHYANKPNVFVFDNAMLGLSKNALSVSAAIVIAKRLGATSFVLCCFDACVNQKTAYAKCVGYKAEFGGKLSRFLSHRKKIERRADGTKITWVIPNGKEITINAKPVTEASGQIGEETTPASTGFEMGKEKECGSAEGAENCRGTCRSCQNDFSPQED